MSFKDAVRYIIFSGDDSQKIKKGIDSLYATYSSITHIEADNLTNDESISTPQGIAVSQKVAAHCLKDVRRTSQFLRGIHKAIEEKLEKGGKVNVLYAGCGPYATLVTPLTQLFSSKDVSFTMLDINASSLLAVRKIYAALEVEAFVEEYIEADATDQSLDLNKSFDIIISETMQMGLRNECQVPLTRNLVRFLKPEGHFIPQQVSIDIYVAGNENKYNPKDTPRHLLGNAYNLDFLNVPKPFYTSALAVPHSDFKYLEMFTSIKVYKNYRLEPYESSLTVPIYLDKFSDRVPSSISFEYQETEKPDFKMVYSFNE